MDEIPRYDIELTGCTPEPLMSYLKALGILRLVSEQKDEFAQGWWQNDIFHIYSILDKDALLRFFLGEYKPTPVVAPWGARSGFFNTSSENSAREALEEILNEKDIRFDKYKQTILLVHQVLKETGLDKKAKDEEKLRLLEICRNRFPDYLLNWLDACYVLTSDGRKFPPLLGTGGNEGSGSYVSGFAQQIVQCLIKHNHDNALPASLFEIISGGITSSQTPGHFSPRSSGGANAGQGFDGPVTTNPWDYIFCIEGTIVWTSAAVRRFGSHGTSMAAFPFTVNVTGAGEASLSFNDQNKPKQAKRPISELWLPIWNHPAYHKEIQSFIAEGRATVTKRTAENGIDFARAVATLGVDRGINAFHRNIFLMRNGQSFLCIPKGRFNVHDEKNGNLLNQIDPWLTAFRRVITGKNIPPRFNSSLHNIDSSIFSFCKYGSTHCFQEILVALGEAEHELVTAEQLRGKLRPLSGLSSAWVEAADDGSTEFAIARAIASVYDQEGKVSPLRANLEPVDWRKNCRSWAEKNYSVVWNSANLITNMKNILQRRIMDGHRQGTKNLPIESRSPVSLDVIAMFINGNLDEDRIAKLIWGLILVNDNGKPGNYKKPEIGPSLPRPFALLKMLFLPELRKNGDLIPVKPEPRIIPLLSGNHPGEACIIAARRLRSSGFTPIPGVVHGRSSRDDNWRELDRKTESQIDCLRLAAALLLPITKKSVNELITLVTRDHEIVN